MWADKQGLMIVFYKIGSRFSENISGMLPDMASAIPLKVPLSAFPLKFSPFKLNEKARLEPNVSSVLIDNQVRKRLTRLVLLKIFFRI